MAFDNHQLKAIANDSDALIILAGAGSGKTTTTVGSALRARNAESITKQLPRGTKALDVPQEKIRIVSFTNNAADNFKERIEYASGDTDVSDIRISTMDRFAISVIQHIYPNADVDLDEHTIAKVLYNDLANKTLLPLYFDSYGDYLEALNQGRSAFAKLEEKALYESKYTAYLDLYVQTLVNRYEATDTFTIPLDVIYKFAIITMVEHRFVPDIELLIIDELQDTTDPQFVFISLIKAQNKNMKLIGVGDVSQSIYRWNEAKPQRVAQFIDEYKADVRQLPNNYRSHPEIVKFTNELLEENLDNISGLQMNAKSTIPFRKDIADDERIQYILDIGSMTERVKEMLDSGIPPKDIAIVARSKSVIDKIADINDNKHRIPLDHSDIDRSKKSEYLSYLARRIRYFIVRFNEGSMNEHRITGDLFSFLYKSKLDPAMNSLTDIASIQDYKDKLCKAFRDNPEQFTSNMTTLLELQYEKISTQLNFMLFNKQDVKKGEGVRVATIHGIKGEEYPYVFYVPSLQIKSDYHIEVDKELSSENREYMWGKYSEIQNLHHVAVTRAIEQLFIVSPYIKPGESAKARRKNPMIEKYNDIEALKEQEKPYNKDIAILLSRMNL